MWNLVFLFTGLVFISLLVIVFLSKPRMKSKENKVFCILSFLNLIGFIIEITLQFIVIYFREMELLSSILTRFYMVYIFVWFTIFSIYTFLVSYSGKGELEDNSIYKIIKYTHIAIAILGSVAIFAMPMQKFYLDGQMYSYGVSTDFLKIMLTGYVSVWTVRLCLNFKTIREKKNYPIIITILLLFVNIIIQTIAPSVLIATVTMTFTCYIIFFTIENPDIRMIKELSYSKALAERSRTETIDVLNGIQNELKSSIDSLVDFGYKEIRKDNIGDELEYAQKYSIGLADKISGVIDLAKISSGSYTINNSKYDTKDMIDNLKYLYMIEKGNRNVSLTMVVSDKLNSVLYGDFQKVEQVSLYLLSYIVNAIKKGSVSIFIDSMNVGRFSRLKFHYNVDYDLIRNSLIELKCYSDKKYPNDTDKRYTLKGDSDNLNYWIFNKLLDLLKARVDVRVISDKKVEIVLLVDQRIMSEYEIIENNVINRDISVKYFKASDKRILIVNANHLKLRELRILFKPYKCAVDMVTSIEQMLTNLDSNKTYDLVLIDDLVPNFDVEIDKITKMFKSYSGYSVPIMVMVKENKNSLENKYKDMGLECVIKPMNKRNINGIAYKYLK